jgi:hypothetical protein
MFTIYALNLKFSQAFTFETRALCDRSRCGKLRTILQLWDERQKNVGRTFLTANCWQVRELHVSCSHCVQ